MATRMLAVPVKANGELRLPKPIRKRLHLKGRGDLIGFVLEGSRVLLTKATVIPEPSLTDEELAYLARLSKRGAGRRTFRTSAAALRHLWSL